MNIDDMILVSIDDHVVEPRDMFDDHVPKKYAEYVPKVVVDDKGIDRWIYRDRPTGVTGLNAVVSWPPEEWGYDPAGYAEMRPAVYDIHDRVRDMDANGVLASMCFPTFTGFSAGHLSRGGMDEITVAMISAYNDWHIEEWAGAYPGRFIPIAILPLWEPQLAVDEINRVAAKGCHSVTMPELPHIDGLPSYHDIDYWSPVFQALSDNDTVMNLHIGQGFGILELAPDAPIDNLMVLGVTDPTSLKLRHEIGIDNIAWECDYPHSDSLWPGAPEFVLHELESAGADDSDIDKITWQNACRFFGWDPFARTPRERATVGALRAAAADVDLSTTTRRQYAERYAAEHAS